MTFTDWLDNTRTYAKQYEPRTAARVAASELYMGIGRRAGRLIQQFPVRGRPIWDHEWEVLIVLDACRVDALREVAPEYDWLPEPDEIGTTVSTGSMSEEWMETNFTDEYAAEKAETAHITWNAFSSHVLDEENWALLDPVWEDVWEDGCVPPRAMTERAVETWRSENPAQMIVHYMQPHRPYRSVDRVEHPSHEEVGQRHVNNTTVWDLLRAGEMSREEAWEAYLDNLRWVLDEVDTLRTNLSAWDVALTADHGDCFGEWGFYGHPRGVPLPELVEVPWVPLDACDEMTLQPEEYVDDGENAPDPDVEERLQELGYV